MSAPTPEQRAEWRGDAHGMQTHFNNTPEADRILALLDALDAAEMRDRAATNLARSAQVRAERAEVAIVRIEALADEWATDADLPPAARDLSHDLRAALNGAER